MIRFTCPHCGSDFKIGDEFSGKRGKCPGCQNMLDIPLHSEPADAKPAPRNEVPKTLLYVILAVVGCWAILATILAVGGMLGRGQLKADHENAVQLLKADHEKTVQLLKAENTKLQSDMAKLRVEKNAIAAGVIARAEGRLHERYGNLHKIEDARGANKVGELYVKSFSLKPPSGKYTDIEYVFVNTTAENIKPDFNLYFLNKDGLFTGQDFCSWATSMRPGERRTDNGSVRFHLGEPAYYFVDF